MKIVLLGILFLLGNTVSAMAAHYCNKNPDGSCYCCVDYGDCFDRPANHPWCQEAQSFLENTEVNQERVGAPRSLSGTQVAGCPNRVFVAECSLYKGVYDAGKTPIGVGNVYFDGKAPGVAAKFAQGGHLYFAQLQPICNHGHNYGYCTMGLNIGMDDGRGGFLGDIEEGKPLDYSWVWGLPENPETADVTMRCFNPVAPHIPM